MAEIKIGGKIIVPHSQKDETEVESKKVTKKKDKPSKKNKKLVSKDTQEI